MTSPALSILRHLATQVPPEAVPVAHATSIPLLDDLIRGGPYGIIAILLIVIRFLYMELKAEREARLKDRDRYETDKQTLNNQVLTVSRETMTAVLQNTAIQRELVAAIRDQEAP